MKAERNKNSLWMETVRGAPTDCCRAEYPRYGRTLIKKRQRWPARTPRGICESAARHLPGR